METVEFENQKTGQTRKFPAPLFEALVQLALQVIKPEEREKAEIQVGRMVASWVDEAPEADPIRRAGLALMVGEIDRPSLPNPVEDSAL